MPCSSLEPFGWPKKYRSGTKFLHSLTSLCWKLRRARWRVVFQHNGHKRRSSSAYCLCTQQQKDSCFRVVACETMIGFTLLHIEVLPSQHWTSLENSSPARGHLFYSVVDDDYHQSLNCFNERCSIELLDKTNQWGNARRRFDQPCPCQQRKTVLKVYSKYTLRKSLWFN